MRKTWVIGLATLLGLFGAYQGVMVTTEHLQEPAFPDHARFHASVGGLYILALSILALVLAWGPYRREAPGAGLSLLATLAATPLGVLVAVSLVPAGAPPAWAIYLAVLSLAVVGAIGVLNYWPGGARQ